MSAHGERQLILHLLDGDSMSVLVREGMDEECVPTEELRGIYKWSLDRFYRGGMTMAPSKDLMFEEWEEELETYEIDLDETPSDSIETVIDDLKGSYIHKYAQDFNKKLASDIAEATTSEKVEVLGHYASELVKLSLRLESRERMVDARDGLGTRLMEYDKRALDKESYTGMHFGIPEIDDYTRGIHPGELAMIAAGPKVGKSFMAALVALKEWQEGKTVVFYTLENSIEMTQDRIVTFATGINAREWQQGKLDEFDRNRVSDMLSEMKESDSPLHISQPAPGAPRTIEALVRQAQVLGADSLIIDQLSHIQPKDERQARNFQVREILHQLRNMISTGRDRMPCLLFHQINRDGVVMADKANMLRMDHLAESADAERTADWVFGIHRSQAEVTMNMAKFQTLASRREQLQHFMLLWNVSHGQIAYRSPWRPV